MRFALFYTLAVVSAIPWPLYLTWVGAAKVVAYVNDVPINPDQERPWWVYWPFYLTTYFVRKMNEVP